MHLFLSLPRERGSVAPTRVSRCQGDYQTDSGVIGLDSYWTGWIRIDIGWIGWSSPALLDYWIDPRGSNWIQLSEYGKQVLCCATLRQRRSGASPSRACRVTRLSKHGRRKMPVSVVSSTEWQQLVHCLAVLAPSFRTRSRFVPPTPPSPKARASTSSRSMATSTRASRLSHHYADQESGAHLSGDSGKTLCARKMAQRYTTAGLVSAKRDNKSCRS